VSFNLSLFSSKFARCAVAASSTIAMTGACVCAFFVYKLPVLGSEGKSNVDELNGKKWTFPGESGFWISYSVNDESACGSGCSGGITWMARKGIVPTECRLFCNFDQCWGSRLSTIEGGDWNVPHNRYQMVGRIYCHYKPVQTGTPGSVLFHDQAFSKDGMACAGDFTRVR